jgi:hypothetical protein
MAEFEKTLVVEKIPIWVRKESPRLMGMAASSAKGARAPKNTPYQSSRWHKKAGADSMSQRWNDGKLGAF